MTDLLQDVRYSLRQLRKSPVFAAILSDILSIATVVLVTGYEPARRAVVLDPMIALRYE